MAKTNASAAAKKPSPRARKPAAPKNALIKLSPAEVGNVVKFLASPTSGANPFSDPIGRHHQAYYADPNDAKAHIKQAVGDYSKLHLFGRQVLCAVYCRPARTPGGIILPEKDQKEDWWQGKVVMILACGPGAFKGDESFHNETYGEGIPAPAPGDWLFANANAGIQISMRFQGASRPQGVDSFGKVMDMFVGDGWPCRIFDDTHFYGRIEAPHVVV